MWVGYTQPKDFRLEDGTTTTKVNGLCRWFTNLTAGKKNEELILTKAYNENSYPTYDNYDAINVDKVTDIPKDYSGIMGVPITFFDKYNPNQFEIIDLNPHFFTIVEQGLPKPDQLHLAKVGRKDPYARVLIRKI